MTSELIARLRADLTAANFSVSALTGLWGAPAEAALHRNQRVPALRALAALRERLGRIEPSATLAQLFVLGLPVSATDIGNALSTLGLHGAEELGLIASEGDEVRPLLDLRPYSFIDAHGAGSWWIASDLGELALGHALTESHVLGIGGASLTLTGLMIPTPVKSVLDLGTGCGIQAMHAARHAEHVVATDISERALELAALNAELNGIRNIEFRLGSLFDPVAGERFDHIISNPPFVITPRVDGVPSYEYRDGGLVGDAIVEAVVRGAADHLNPGGIAQMLGNWEYRTDAAGAETDAFDRLRDWLAAVPQRPFDGDSGENSPLEGQNPTISRKSPSNGDGDGQGGVLDAWVIEREAQLPTEYAETWIRDGGTLPESTEFDRLYDAWLDDFAARGVRKVGFGYLMLRRPVGGDAPQPLLRFERLHGELGTNGSGLGAHLADCLYAQDWNMRTDAAALLEATLTVAPDVTEERHYWPGADDPTMMTLHQGGGFGRSVQLDTALAALVGACDGELTVGAIIAALAQLLDADEDALRTELAPKVRELVNDGFLLPPSS